MTRVGFNVEQLKATEKVPLINFTQRWKKSLMLQKSLPIMRHTDRKKKEAQPIIKVLRKDMFCHHLEHGVPSVWLWKANQSRVFSNGSQNYNFFRNFSKVEEICTIQWTFFEKYSWESLYDLIEKVCLPRKAFSTRSGYIMCEVKMEASRAEGKAEGVERRDFSTSALKKMSLTVIYWREIKIPPRWEHLNWPW